MSARLALCALVASLAALPRVALAQAGEAAPAEPAGPSAVQLGRLGVERFQAGAFAESFDAFSRAEKLKHSPVFVLYMARSARHLGRLIEARELFRKTANEVIAPDASPSWTQARADAKGELSALEPRIPSLKVRVEGAAEGGVVVTIDGAAAAVDTRVERDPGTFVVRASPRTGTPVEERVTLKEGDRDVVVTLSIGGARAGDEEAPAAAPGGGGSYVPGAIVLGIGGAGLLVGAITGFVAIGQADEALAPCDEGVCPTAQEDAVDSASTMANVSTISLVVGAAVAATGVVLLVVLGEEEAPPTEARRGPKAGVRSRLVVGPGWAGASGTF